MAGTKVVVATPAFGEIFYTPYVQSLVRFQSAAHKRNWTIQHMAMSYAHINESRNALITHWYDKTDASHLLFVDADMGFAPQLIFDMVALNKPVVGVIYTKCQVDLHRLTTLAAKGEPPERAIARAHDFIIRPLRRRPPRRLNGFVEVAGCGTGIMLIQRTTIATMLKTLPGISDATTSNASPLAAGLDRMIRVFDNITVDDTLLVNDFAFCHRWQVLCKGELWARADQSVTHIGLHKFSASYADAAGPRISVKPGPLLTKIARGQALRPGDGKSGARPQKGKPAGT